MKVGRVTVPVIAAALVLALVYLTKKTTAYSEICPRCLQGVSGVKREAFGFTYSHKRHLAELNPHLSANDDQISDAPQLFEELSGHKCNHVFVSQGKCVYSSALVKCYGGSGQYYWRINALKELFELYRRIPDKSLTRRTYDFIEQAQPIGIEIDKSDLPVLSDCMGLVVDTNDWRGFLNSPQQTLTNGFFSEARLLQLLDQTNPTVRLNAFGRLANFDDEICWKKIGKLLGDPQLGPQVQQRILQQRHFALFGAMLRQMASESRRQTPDTFKYWPYSQDAQMIQMVRDLREEEIQSLLVQKDKYVDVLCFAAIAVQEKLQFVEQMVAVLNKRGSDQAIIAIQELLAGPSPFNERDPHIWGSPRTVPELSFAWSRVAKPSKMPSPDSWLQLQKDFERMIETCSEWEAANVVLALSACDQAKTSDWLLDELPRTTNPKRRACILAGMGAVADPMFLPVLMQLDASPARPRRPDFPPQSICLDYALHRCRGIDLWRVEKNPEGQYVLIKPRRVGGAVQ